MVNKVHLPMNVSLQIKCQCKPSNIGITSPAQFASPGAPITMFPESCKKKN